MKRFFTLLLGILWATIVNGQVSPFSLSPDWYFGQGGRLTFPTGDYPTSGAPTIGNMPTNNSTGVEASTSVCFRDGNVAMYSNSMQGYNGNPANAGWWDFIRNFSTDNTCAGSSTGACVAFPDPASPDDAFYFVLANDVTSGGCANQGVSRYRFTGTGTAVAYNAGPTTIAPNAFAGEAITVGNDGTGGYWLVVHNKGTANTFRVWHYTAGGITGPVDQTVGAPVSNVSSSQSYLKISPCQDKVAYHSGGILVVHEWNRTTGTVGAELRRITPVNFGVGLEFSPNGNRVYYSGQGTTVNWVDIGTGTTGSVAGSSWSLQLGPDGRIYGSPTGTNVGVISSPNAGPSWGTMALPGGASIFRGLSNIAWLSPELPDIDTSSTCLTMDFSYVFQNYFLTDIDVASVRWDFGEGAGWEVGQGNTPSHTYASSGNYTARVEVTDATCGHTFVGTIPVTVADCPAPVEWLNFMTTKQNGKAYLHWSTASETNNDYFVIERSLDGISFVPVAKVNGQGNSINTTDYNYVDKLSENAVVYYRIRQVDFDGSSTLSVVRSIDNTGLLNVTLSPNPSTSTFTIQLPGNADQSVIVYDVLGKVMEQFTTGANELTFGNDYTDGVYIVKVMSGKSETFIRAIKE